MQKFNHIPVMLDESIQILNIAKDGIYANATYGCGGHSKAILSKLGENGRLIVFDRDPSAIEKAKQNLGTDARVTIINAEFSKLAEKLIEKNYFGKVDGILFDLGICSVQVDDPQRGFSFCKDAYLNMRMDQEKTNDACYWINNASLREIIICLKKYGEERFANKIAKDICTARLDSPITRTKQLADLIVNAIPKKFHKLTQHPATKSFQAIRIVVNQELTQIELAIKQAFEALKCYGRLVFISFNSLEDRIVKRFFKEGVQPKLHKDIPVNPKQTMQYIVKKIRTSNREIAVNARARSATLRAVYKL